jgi:hypothetical protein
MRMRRLRAVAVPALAAVAVALAGCGGSEPAGWGPPEPIPSTRAGQMSAAFAGDGRALAVWTEQQRGEQRLMFAERPPGSGWKAAEPIIENRRWSIIAPRLAVDAHGDAAVTFSLFARQSRALVGSYRPAGGTWEKPQALAPIARNLGEPVLGIGERGQVVVAWPEYGPGRGLGVSRRDAGGGWNDPGRVSLGMTLVEADPAFAQDDRAYILAEDFGLGGTSRPKVLVSGTAGWTTLPGLPEAAGRQLQGVLALDADGRPTVVAFRPGQRPGAGALVVTRLGADGRWSPSQVLDRARGSWFGTVRATSTDEGVLVAWTRWTAPRTGVSVRAALVEDGRPVAPSAEVDSFDVPGAKAPATRGPVTGLRLSAGGRPALLWDRATAPGGRHEARLMAARFEGGAWTTPEAITDGPLAALPAAIHADDERTVALWREPASPLGGPAAIVASERAVGGST